MCSCVSQLTTDWKAVWGGAASFWLCGTGRRRWGFSVSCLMALWELVTLLGTSNQTWEGGVSPAILIYQSHQRTEVFFMTCLNRLVLCVGFGRPRAGQVADQLSNLFFHPSPTVSCPGVKTEKSSKGMKEKWVESPGSLGDVKATGDNCKAKYYRDMYSTEGTCGELTVLEAERWCLGLKRKALGHWTAGNQGSVVLLLREQLVFRAWQYCIVVKCVWRDWFIAIMIYGCPPDTYLRGCGGVQLAMAGYKWGRRRMSSLTAGRKES